MNTVAMVALAHELDVKAEIIQQTLSSFKSVKRRQEVRGELAGVTVVDDFAHHPTAVQSTIEALRLYYGGRRLWAIFEPRTNSSKRRVFQKRYATAFDGADVVLIKKPVGLERIAQNERLSSRQLVADIASRGVEAHYCRDTDAVLDVILVGVRRGDVLIVMSTGSFDNLHERLLGALNERHHSAT